MRASECASNPGILYKLTTADCRCKHADTIWGEGVEHTAPGERWRYDQIIHVYRDPLVAVLLDPIHAKYGASALLWECEGDICSDAVTKVYCTRLRTKRRIPLPDLTIDQRVEIGIRCALTQHPSDTFKQWAKGWLLNEDRSEASARARAGKSVPGLAAGAAEAAAAGIRELAMWRAATAAAWITARADGASDLAAVCRQVVCGQEKRNAVSDCLRIGLVVEDTPVTCGSGPSQLSILVSPAGPHRFRIEDVHGLVEAFRYGDVIEAEPVSDGAWRFLRVVKRGRYRQVSLLLSRPALDSPKLQSILDQLVEHDGQWERVAGGWLTMAMPYGMPFNPLHHIRQLSRAVIKTGKLVVNLDTRSVDVDGRRLHVTGKEYSVLELLSLRKGTTVTREMLLDHLYDSTDDPEIKTIAAFIAKLRKKIATATGGPDYIETVWGRGYALKDPAPSGKRLPV